MKLAFVLETACLLALSSAIGADPRGLVIYDQDRLGDEFAVPIEFKAAQVVPPVVIVRTETKEFRVRRDQVREIFYYPNFNQDFVHDEDIANLELVRAVYTQAAQRYPKVAATLRPVITRIRFFQDQAKVGQVWFQGTWVSKASLNTAMVRPQAEVAEPSLLRPKSELRADTPSTAQRFWVESVLANGELKVRDVESVLVGVSSTRALGMGGAIATRDAAGPHTFFLTHVPARADLKPKTIITVVVKETGERESEGEMVPVFRFIDWKKPASFGASGLDAAPPFSGK